MSGSTGGEVYALLIAPYPPGDADAPLVLYAGGNFSAAGGVPADSLAMWDGSTWHAVVHDFQVIFGVEDLVIFDDGQGGGAMLYACGWFIEVDGVTVNRIARWDGTAWWPVGAGFTVPGSTTTSMNALAVFDDGRGAGARLYIGGAISHSDGQLVGFVSRWNGMAWEPTASTYPTDDVFALHVFDDGSGPALYAGGRFGFIGGFGTPSVDAKCVAKFDGVAWSPLGEGLASPPGVPRVLALVDYDDGSGRGSSLYAGGLFSHSGTTEVKYIARWNGESWEPVGGGVTGLVSSTAGVSALAAHDPGDGPRLYVGGGITHVGEPPLAVDGIASWDGTSWSTLDPGLVAPYSDPYFFALEPTVAPRALARGVGEGLYIGGTFDGPGVANPPVVALWGKTLSSGPSDLFCDGVVDGFDLATLLSAWGPCPLPGRGDCPADFDGDGFVNGVDLAILLGQWS
jgi:hypothetical protein